MAAANENNNIDMDKKPVLVFVYSELLFSPYVTMNSS